MPASQVIEGTPLPEELGSRTPTFHQLSEAEVENLKLQYHRAEGRRKSPAILVNTASLEVSSGNSLKVPRLLVDTGAEDQSFIDSSFAVSTQSTVFTLQNPLEVRLGDNKTLIHITEYILATLVLVDPDGNSHEGFIKLFIMNTGFDIILGMPDILRFFTPFLCSVLVKAASDFKTSDFHALLRYFPRYDSPGEVLPHTFENIDEEAAELVNDVIPESSFLYWMTKSREEHIQDFHSILQEHCKNPELFELIKGDLEEYIDVFIPELWHGVYPHASPLLPLELKTLSNLPAFLKPAARSVPQSLMEPYKREMTRMCTYFYELCDSPWASPQHVAAKKTAPFIRNVGDYRGINVFFERSQWPMPLPLDLIHQVIQYKILLDIDLRNGYHNLPLALRTSLLLAVQGPDGVYRPKFLPEGVGPASGVFQRVMQDIFKPLPFVFVLIIA